MREHPMSPDEIEDFFEEGLNLDPLRDRMIQLGNELSTKYGAHNPFEPSEYWENAPSEAYEFAIAGKALDGSEEASWLISRNGFECPLVWEYYRLASDLRL